MSKMIQIRNVPDELHRQIKQRALDEGTTMSELVMRVIAREVARPSRRALLEKWAARDPDAAPVDWAAIIREERDARAERWS